MAYVFFKRRPLVSAGPSYDPVFANNDWATIIAVCQAGFVPDEWAVGDQKTMTINGTDYPIDIIGKYHDEYSDGGGKAPLTFQMHDCYGTTYAMNAVAGNASGWTNSEIRTIHLPNILALMPSEVQSAVKEVTKLSSAGTKSTDINTTADKLFLLSEIEIFGVVEYSVQGEGSQYAYYSAGNSTIKKLNGTAEIWWERSPFATGTAAFCRVYSSGARSGISSAYSHGLSFAFCF